MVWEKMDKEEYNYIIKFDLIYLCEQIGKLWHLNHSEMSNIIYIHLFFQIND